MKKISLFTAGLLMLTAISCDNEDPIIHQDITGTWKPIRMVKTTVTHENTPSSETFLYDSCQQESRWTFKGDGFGSHLWKISPNGTQCIVNFESNLQYFYDNKTSDIIINYITHEERGKALDVTPTSMNLKIESIDPITQIYESQVYTLEKVQ